MTRSSLGFLLEAGLAPLPDRRPGADTANGVVLAWAAPTFTVLAAAEDGLRLGLLMVGTETRPSSIDELVDRARRGAPVLVPFGAFWLTDLDRESLEREAEGYVALFRDALGPSGRDVDPAALRAVLRAHEERLARERMVPWLHGMAEVAWQRRAWAEYVQWTDELTRYGVPVDADRRASATAQLADLVPPPAWPPTVEGIRRAADRLNETHGGQLMFLVFSRMITHELADATDRLKAADPTAVEPSLVFLEADPWAFRTGYLKEKVMRRLRRCPLDEDQQARLRAVLLHLVEVGPRREFREACRLAWRVADPVFMEALRARAGGDDRGTAVRARAMLDAIRPPAGS
ncbi:MAG: hypothetical protein U0869_19830 [Chloroflexota bacterium]